MNNIKKVFGITKYYGTPQLTDSGEEQMAVDNRKQNGQKRNPKINALRRQIVN